MNGNLVPLKLPPGVSSNGTEYENKGRYYSADLVRWHMGKLQPIGGWSELVAAGTLTGTPRAIHTWKGAAAYAAIASEEGLWTLEGSTLTDRTPLAWVNQSASSAWSLANGGDWLLGMNDAEGTLYKWASGDTDAAALANAPTGTGVFVTDDRIPVVLGAGGDGRVVQWCDPDDFTLWTPTFTNLAGSLEIQTAGQLMQGLSVRGAELLLTTEDAHILRFIGLPDVYGQESIGANCGVISRQGGVSNKSWAMWMGRDNFYRWNGYIDTIPCEIHDEVFNNINLDQAAKVRAVHIPEFSEIWWFYPVGSENDRVAVLNYKENHWATHQLARSCAAPRGDGWTYPLMVTSAGAIYEHENGNTMTGAGTPKARTAPLEIGSGDQITHLRRIMPDEGTAGDVQLKIYTRSMPNAAETLAGTFTAANPMQCRIAARQMAFEFEQVRAADWRVGNFRAEIVQAGRR